MSDDEIAEADPVTQQYPFLTAASGESGDSSTTYFVLSKNPSLLQRYKEDATEQAMEEPEATANNDDEAYNEEEDECMTIEWKRRCKYKCNYYYFDRVKFGQY